MAKILLIDDDVAFNETLKKFLEYEGFEVVCAFDGKQGLMLFRQERPNLVITDLVMPEQDGIGFLRKIMVDFDCFPCKVIAISGGGRIGGGKYLDIAKGLGVDDVLDKPFGMADLLKSIGKTLS